VTRVGAAISRVVASAAAAGAVLALSAPRLAGQTPDALAEACVGQGGSAAACAASATAGQALQGHLGLLGGLGSEVSGTATTLGTRIEGGPRFALAARMGGVDMDLPDLARGSGSGGDGALAWAIHGDLTLGLFDGFQLMPTVGGFLSIDAFGRAAFLFLPSSLGFDGNTSAYTAGVRVGVFREGFTIPGVSVSVSRRFVGAVDLGGADEATSVRVDPTVTSYRATVGKDLFAVEWLAGMGWEDYGGDVRVTVPDGLGGSVAATEEVTSSRRIYFASASMTFSIILNVALEAGWAEGFGPVAAYDGSFDPSSGTPFGSLSMRLIL
jgi:hypothetical protein